MAWIPAICTPFDSYETLPTVATGNYYLSFDGTGYVTVPDNAALDVGAGDFSICSVIAGTDGTKMALVAKAAGGAGYQVYGGADYLAAVLADGVGGTWTYRIPISNVNSGNWTFLAVVKNSSGIAFYVNGAAIATEQVVKTGTPNGDNTGDLVIGFDTTNYFLGSLDDFRLYKKALSEAEVDAIYANGIGKKYAISDAGAAAAAWNCDEGAGATATDTVAGLVGTITGGVTWIAGGTPFVGTSIEERLCYLLSSDALIASMVSRRIYPNIIPERAAMPAITYQQISGDRDHDMDGAEGYVTGRFQINCWDSSYGGAKDLSDIVRMALDGYSGLVSTHYIQRIFLMDEGDMPEVEPELNSTRIRYGKRLDFEIVWNETP